MLTGYRLLPKLHLRKEGFHWTEGVGGIKDHVRSCLKSYPKSFAVADP